MKKKFKQPSAEQTKKKLKKLAQASKRKAMLEDGAYDGRYREKRVVDKKFKKPKHKKKIVDDSE